MAAGAVGGGVLAACGSSNKSGAASTAAKTTAKSFGTLNFQLPWLKDVSGSGEYFAITRGYYRQAGFSSINLIAGGPSAPPAETVVTQGKAIVGVSAPDLTASAILHGAPVTIIGAQQQKGPFCVMSLASKPIDSPQQMIGKRIGVQSSNIAIWHAFLQANNIDPSKITSVPVQFDPTPLTTGEVDGWLANVNNEPIQLASKGFKTKLILFADFNYPLVDAVYVVRTDSLQSKSDELKAMMSAEIRGWKDAIADPAGAARLAADDFGKNLGLNVKEQIETQDATIPLMVTPYTKQHGLFLISDSLIAQNIRALAQAKIKIQASKLFDMSLLESLYASQPSLV